MIARRTDITESTVKVHVKHMLKKMKLKSRVEAAVWVHRANLLRRVRRETRRGKLDQRLGQRRGDLIGDALPCLSSTTTDRRQRFAAPGSLFHTGIMMLQPSGLLASTGGVRLRAGVSLPVQRLDAMQTMDLQLQLHRLPDCRSGRRGQIDRQILR